MFMPLPDLEVVEQLVQAFLQDLAEGVLLLGRPQRVGHAVRALLSFTRQEVGGWTWSVRRSIKKSMEKTGKTSIFLFVYLTNSLYFLPRVMIHRHSSEVTWGFSRTLM